MKLKTYRILFGCVYDFLRRLIMLATDSGARDSRVYLVCTTNSLCREKVSRKIILFSYDMYIVSWGKIEIMH